MLYIAFNSLLFVYDIGEKTNQNPMQQWLLLVQRDRFVVPDLGLRDTEHVS